MTPTSLFITLGRTAENVLAPNLMQVNVLGAAEMIGLKNALF